MFIVMNKCYAVIGRYMNEKDYKFDIGVHHLYTNWLKERK